MKNTWTEAANVRHFGKPEEYSGDWRGWSHLVFVYWFSFLYGGAEECSVVEGRREANKGLYMASSLVCKGQLFEIIKGAPPPPPRKRGAWRRLVQ